MRPRERAGLIGVGGAVFMVAVLVAAIVSPLAGELTETLRGGGTISPAGSPPASVARGEEPRVLSVQVVRPPALPMGGMGPAVTPTQEPAGPSSVVPHSPPPSAGAVPGAATAYVGRTPPALDADPAPPQQQQAPQADRSSRSADQVSQSAAKHDRKKAKAHKLYEPKPRARDADPQAAGEAKPKKAGEAKPKKAGEAKPKKAGEAAD